MNNYSNETEIMVATGLDMTALSPRSQRHLMQYMDQEGESVCILGGLRRVYRRRQKMTLLFML